jgi:hypothetical protein
MQDYRITTLAGLLCELAFVVAWRTQLYLCVAFIATYVLLLLLVGRWATACAAILAHVCMHPIVQGSRICCGLRAWPLLGCVRAMMWGMCGGGLLRGVCGGG